MSDSNTYQVPAHGYKIPRDRDIPVYATTRTAHGNNPRRGPHKSRATRTNHGHAHSKPLGRDRKHVDRRRTGIQILMRVALESTTKTVFFLHTQTHARNRITKKRAQTRGRGLTTSNGQPTGARAKKHGVTTGRRPRITSGLTPGNALLPGGSRNNLKLRRARH